LKDDERFKGRELNNKKTDFGSFILYTRPGNLDLLYSAPSSFDSISIKSK
jgi:hypothetical protein